MLMLLFDETSIILFTVKFLTNLLISVNECDTEQATDGSTKHCVTEWETEKEQINFT